MSVRLDNQTAKFKRVESRSFSVGVIGEQRRWNVVTVEYHVEASRAVDTVFFDFGNRKAYVCVQRVEPGYEGYYKLPLKLILKGHAIRQSGVDDWLGPWETDEILRHRIVR